MFKVLVAIVILAVTSVAQLPVPALPQTYIKSTYIASVGGQTWRAHSSTDLKAALSAALPGDAIVLDAGVTYTGNFTLPAKVNPNNKWIYLIGSASASLPAPGTRINPAADAAKMPKIVTTNTTAPLTLPPGANHYRLVGLEVYSASTQGCNLTSTPPVNCFSYQLINAASVPGSQLVDSVTIDRCYLHGSPAQDVRAAIVANGSNFAIVDSYISEIHQSVNDSQAIVAWYTPGPVKITNNYLEATGENVMFGGAGGLSNPWVPSDIEVRQNYFFKQPGWAQAAVTLPPNNKWVVKNHFELKSARRVLVDGNVLENVWVSGQAGFSFMLTPRTNSSGLLAVVDDVTIRNNLLKNVTSGFDTLPWDNACLPANGCSNVGESKRVGIYNNLILLRDPKLPGGGDNYGLMVLRDSNSLVFQHNTIIPPPGSSSCKWGVYFDASGKGLPVAPASLTNNVWILDNVLCRQTSGPGGAGTAALTAYMGNPAPMGSRYVGNVMFVPTGDKLTSWPVHNYAATLPFVYLSATTGNYQLSSPAWTDTSDGQLAGVNSASLP